jgi:hypothetical protein
MSRSTLTVIDNRTGRGFELAIEDGVPADDLRQVALYHGEGLSSYDPGIANTTACRSAITCSFVAERQDLDGSPTPLQSTPQHATSTSLTTPNDHRNSGNRLT